MTSDIWNLTEFDAPLEQMYGVHSEKDRKYWELLDELGKRFPHSELHKMTHWQAYTKRILMIRYLAHYELFKMTVGIPGSIVLLPVFNPRLENKLGAIPYSEILLNNLDLE